MIIGFTGTRNGMTSIQRQRVKHELQVLKPTELHHGDCVGADAQAHALACELDIPVVIHPPLQTRFRAHCSGGRVLARRGYLERDRSIVQMCDRLIATPKESEEQTRGGTWYTVHYAIRTNTPVVVFWPDGTETRRFG